jgi:predicted ATPase
MHTALAEALDHVGTTGQHVYEAELYRLKGTLSLDVVRRQQAKSLELRATMRLSRLWPQQGKQAEAGQLLTEIYSWFTEGCDTADLEDAKALLEELAW